jgi:molybdopterin converting factor subunit 1
MPDAPFTARVLLFSILREHAGADALEITLPAGATAADALRAAAQQLPLLAEHPGAARVAVNRTYASDETPVRPGDELALLTPVSGG